MRLVTSMLEWWRHRHQITERDAIVEAALEHHVDAIESRYEAVEKRRVELLQKRLELVQREKRV